jgi:allantoinase
VPDLTAERIVRGQRVLTPFGLQPTDLVIGEGRILALEEAGSGPAGVPVDDVGDLVVMPGLVDSHVHVNEPGRTEWEGFETATRAAIAGGITTITDMPLNCTPVTTTAAALKEKLEALEGLLHTDTAFWGGVVPDNLDDLEDLADAGVVGAKAFMIHSGIDDFPSVDGEQLSRAMKTLGARGLPLLAHAELAAPGEDEQDLEKPTKYRSFLESRPPRWEVDAIQLLVDLMAAADCHVHVVHLSAADALPVVQAAREKRLPLTVETCPHYLTLAAEQIGDGKTAFKCCPPIRGEENRQALWGALEAGLIDQVVSDHSPCTPELKVQDTGDFQVAWGGISSLQFGLQLVWTEARDRGFGLVDLARWMAAAPARLIGLRGVKGGLTPGHDADLVVWNPEEDIQVTRDAIRHRHKVTPYLGRKLKGRVYRTYLRGQLVHDDGKFPEGAAGRPVFHPSSPAAKESP